MGRLLATIVGFLAFMLMSGLFVLIAWPLLLLIPLVWYVWAGTNRRHP